ncbi:hypothetical protein IVA80_22260 [Bradyrhizobium sp. 139]|uniref:hypothetical protein n=1 Tax=Bradyrhizobium sp. 139 TaxID=2782616 RepID=UPI001FF961C3|nr:hypothetical protein [Bradyrhizobium sp. 139]MCK1743495.1 hypothetical protein [Bradyrhizobium sp. 139]
MLDASEKVVGGLLGILLASIAIRLIERWTAASDVWRFLRVCRVHEALRATPAVALGITDRVWTIGRFD